MEEIDAADFAVVDVADKSQIDGSAVTSNVPEDPASALHVSLRTPGKGFVSEIDNVAAQVLLAHTHVRTQTHALARTHAHARTHTLTAASPYLLSL